MKTGKVVEGRRNRRGGGQEAEGKGLWAAEAAQGAGDIHRVTQIRARHGAQRIQASGQGDKFLLVSHGWTTPASHGITASRKFCNNDLE